jgi:hypothetical protein
MKTHDKERLELSAKVQQYVDEGGEIHCVDHTANHSFKQPIKRTRKAQIDYERRRLKGVDKP